MQENLYLLRKRHGYSQKDIAEYLNISVNQYGEKERGKYEFTQDEMFALSKLFDKRLEEIFLPRNHQNGD